MQDAIAAPKITFIEPDWIAIENDISDDVYKALESRGHRVRRIDWIGNAHGLKIVYDARGNITGYEGGADPRGEGLAKGN